MRLTQWGQIFYEFGFEFLYTGLSSLGVPGVPWHTQILADQLTLFQPGGTDYAHLITTGTPGFSDFPTALHSKQCFQLVSWAMRRLHIFILKFLDLYSSEFFQAFQIGLTLSFFLFRFCHSTIPCGIKRSRRQYQNQIRAQNCCRA